MIVVMDAQSIDPDSAWGGGNNGITAVSTVKIWLEFPQQFSRYVKFMQFGDLTIFRSRTYLEIARLPS